MLALVLVPRGEDDLLDEVAANRGGGAGRRRDRYVAGPRAGRTACAQHGRPGELRRPCEHERRAGSAFLRISVAFGQQCDEFAVVQDVHGAGGFFAVGRPHPKIVAPQVTHR